MSAWSELRDRAARTARAVLGADGYGEAVAAGRRLPPPAALAEVLAAAEALATLSDALGALFCRLEVRCLSPVVTAAAYGLSPREREVLALLTRRFTDQEIAAALFISPRTAHPHASNVLAKLGVDSRREAAAVAVRRGLAYRSRRIAHVSSNWAIVGSFHWVTLADGEHHASGHDAGNSFAHPLRSACLHGLTAM